MSAQVTDYDIQALLDGEMDAELGRKLLEELERDPALYNRYLAYQRQKSLLKSWWKDN
ncbi:MAG: hypothetical protein WC989_08925 [Micavibrio sp.]